MRGLTVLGVALVLASSLATADVANKQVVVAQNEATAVKKAKAAPAARVAKERAASKENFDNDSRVNGYRLEHEGCCGSK